MGTCVVVSVGRSVRWTADYRLSSTATTRSMLRFGKADIVLAFMWPGILAAGTCLAALTPYTPFWTVLAFTLGNTGLFYLLTGSASITVTPTMVTVSNPFVRHTLPRCLVTEVRASKGGIAGYLVVEGAKPIRMAVVAKTVAYRQVPAQLWSVPMADQMLREVPAAASSGEPGHRRRCGNIVLAVTTIVLLAGVAVAAVVSA